MTCCELNLQNDWTYTMKSIVIVYIVYLMTTDRYTLVLNGYDALYEALVKRGADFAGRWSIYTERTIWNVGGRGLYNIAFCS